VPDFEDLYRQHRELARLGAQLKATALDEAAPLTRLVQHRRDVAMLVTRHLAEEAELAVRPMVASAKASDRDLAREYSDSMLTFRETSSSHAARWNMLAIVADRTSYAAAVQWQLDWLDKRRAWEERVFLPAARTLAMTALRLAS
jgi:hypothetical protein